MLSPSASLWSPTTSGTSPAYRRFGSRTGSEGGSTPRAEEGRTPSSARLPPRSKFAYAVRMIAPTPRDRRTDQQGRPYFLWDIEMTLDEFERAVRDEYSATRSYFIGKLMR